MTAHALLVAGYALAINFLAHETFAHDKRQAAIGGWRISEGMLFCLALLGGGFGAKLAQRRFRHKTSKQPFRSCLNVAALAGMLALGLITFRPEARMATAAVASWAADKKPAQTREIRRLQGGGGSTF